MKTVTQQYPDDVEAWIELAGILEQTDVQVNTAVIKVGWYGSRILKAEFRSSHSQSVDFLEFLFSP